MSTPSNPTAAPKSQENALVPAGAPPQGALAPQVNEAAKAFLAEAKGPREVPTKIALIGINHREGKFKLPTGELVPHVDGYPVLYYRTRRYYKKPPQPGAKGAPPDCWSADLLVPHESSLEMQAETCATCTMSQWGTARDGRSQACGTYIWVFLLNPAFGTPPLGVVAAPPSSLKPMLGTKFQNGYLAQAAARHGAYEIVWTRLGLIQAGGADAQVPYCVLAPQMGKPAEIETAKRIAAVRNDFLKIMNEYRMRTPEVETGGDE